MPGFLNSDGSELIGALNASGVGQSLIVDANGYLRVTAASTMQAISDGVATSNVPEVQMGLYNGSSIDRLQGLNGAASVQDWIRQLILQGKGFVGTTGVIAPAAGNYPLSIFNPAASGKSVLIYSLRLSCGSGSMLAQVQDVTSNPNYGSALLISNAKLGGPASAISATCTFAATSQSVIGTVLDVEAGPQNNPIELSSNGSVFLLPAGSSNGIVAYMTTFATGYALINAKWVEF